MRQIMPPAFIMQMFGNGFLLNLTSSGKQTVFVSSQSSEFEMPHVFDNIDRLLLPALQTALGLSDRAGFCASYFNPRGWKDQASQQSFCAKPRSEFLQHEIFKVKEKIHG